MTKVLQINSSVNGENSNSRKLGNALIARFGDASVVERDVDANPVPVMDGLTIGAFYTPEADRSAEQKEAVVLSDELIAELKEADVLVIGAPMYNFSIPATLKAWIDQIGRVGVTFKYTEKGAVGLVEGKKAYIVATTGGAPVNSPVDFATPYLKQFLSFIGITDVEVIDAAGFGVNAEEAMEKALANVAAVALP